MMTLQRRHAFGAGRSAKMTVDHLALEVKVSVEQALAVELFARVYAR